jgi:hypothetical protein
MDRLAEIHVSKSKSTNYQRLLLELASKVKLMLQATVGFGFGNGFALTIYNFCFDFFCGISGQVHWHELSK